MINKYYFYGIKANMYDILKQYIIVPILIVISPAKINLAFFH